MSQQDLEAGGHKKLAANRLCRDIKQSCCDIIKTATP